MSAIHAAPTPSRTRSAPTGAASGRETRRRGQRLIDGLFVRGDDAAEWLAGISELSVSYRPDRAPTVRALAKVIRKRAADPATLAVMRHWGQQQLQRAADAAGAPYGSALFEALFDAFYRGGAAGPPASRPALRFGVATEFSCASPVVKMYLDLHATPGERRPPSSPKPRRRYARTRRWRPESAPARRASPAGPGAAAPRSRGPSPASCRR